MEFSKISLLTALISLGILSFTGPQLYRNTIKTKNDEFAYHEFIKIRDAIYRLEKVTGTPTVLLENNPGTIFKNIELNNKLKLNYLIHLHRRQKRILIFSLTHKDGAHEYRWVDFYGQRRLQKIKI